MSNRGNFRQPQQGREHNGHNYDNRGEGSRGRGGRNGGRGQEGRGNYRPSSNNSNRQQGGQGQAGRTGSYQRDFNSNDNSNRGGYRSSNHARGRENVGENQNKYQGSSTGQQRSSNGCQGSSNGYQKRQGGNGSGFGEKLLRKPQAEAHIETEISKVFKAKPTRLPNNANIQRLAQRPNSLSKAGIWQKVNVRLNMFMLESKAEFAHQYDLQVYKDQNGKYQLTNKELYGQVVRTLRLKFGWDASAIHDGRHTIFSANNQLAQQELDSLKLENGRSVYVTFKYSKVIDMRDLQKQNLQHKIREIGWLVPQECVRVLEAAIRNNALFREDMYKVCGRQIFNLQQRGKRLGNNKFMELLTGYRDSVRVVQQGLVLHLNTLYSAARSPMRVSDFSRAIDNRNLDHLRMAMKGIKVRHEVLVGGKYEKRDYTVYKVSELSANQHRFQTEEYGIVTVAQYYYQKYKYRLQYPEFNLLDCSKGERQTYIPMELCRIKRGQVERVEGDLKAALIKQAAKVPSVRYDDIQRAVNDIDRRINEDATSFWLAIESKAWLGATGYLIPPPAVEYGGGRCVLPQKGEWKGFVLENGRPKFHQYIQPAPIESYAVVHFRDPLAEVQNYPQHSQSYPSPQVSIKQLCEDVINFGGQVGMKIAKLNPRVVINCELRPDVAFLLECLSEANKRAKDVYGKYPQIIFVILKEKNDVYDKVKSILEGNQVRTEFPKLPSQFSVYSNYVKGQRNYGYISKLMQKVNMKVGGSCYRLLSGFDSIPIHPKTPNVFPIMFMGADVTHPTPGENAQQQTSIAGVVASMDMQFTRYAARIRRQTGRQESIQDMYNCTGSLLSNFKEQTGDLPQTIIMYRDGVSEGQFNQVLGHEYTEMQRTFQRFGSDYHPKIVFVTVQKRHLTRPYAKDEAASDGNDKTDGYNLAPGIVIDESGCHPWEWQFYLNSHKTIQGTNKPALYQVLVDEVGFGAEQFYMMTYWLAHTYQRCPRAVSIPAPTYYAHHVCTRGRKLEGQGCTGNMVDKSIKNKMFWI